MPTLNLLAEVLVADDELAVAQRKIDRKVNSPLGKLPFRRSRLASRKLDLDVMRIKIDAAKTYLNTIADIEVKNI